MWLDCRAWVGIYGDTLWSRSHGERHTTGAQVHRSVWSCLPLPSWSFDSDLYRCLQNLRVLLRAGNPTITPKRILRSQWFHDPWTLGSYSYLAKGCSVQDVLNLIEPLPTNSSQAQVPANRYKHMSIYTLTIISWSFLFLLQRKALPTAISLKVLRPLYYFLILPLYAKIRMKYSLMSLHSTTQNGTENRTVFAINSIPSRNSGFFLRLQYFVFFFPTKWKGLKTFQLQYMWSMCVKVCVHQ